MDLVAPIVPNAQENKAAELFLRAMDSGFAQAARFAEMRQRSVLEREQLAANMAIKEKQFEFAREENAQKLELEWEQLDIERGLKEAHADLYRSKAEQEGNAVKRSLEYGQKRRALWEELQKDADALNLNDPGFKTREPVQYAANLVQFNDMYGASPLPEVKGLIKQYRTEADSMRIPLKVGATYNSTAGRWEGGEKVDVPMWQIVRNFQDENRRDDLLSTFEASGLFKRTTRTEGKTQITELGPADSAVARSLSTFIKKNFGVEFKRGKLKESAKLPPKAAYVDDADTLPPGSEGAAATGASLELEPTESDTLLNQARAAIQKGAPEAAVRKMLLDKGVDPDLL